MLKAKGLAKAYDGEGIRRSGEKISLLCFKSKTFHHCDMFQHAQYI
jgi:hypothetical protein